MKILNSWKASPWPIDSFKLPKFQTHRGYWVDGKRENTLAAFQKAREMGSEMIEFDVRMSSDLVPVVFHDPSLEINNHRVNISQLSLTQLRNLAQVMTLEEVLQSDLVPKYLNIEIKSIQALPNLLVFEVIRLIEKYQCQSRVVISSFNPLYLFTVKNLLFNVPIALLASEFEIIENPIYLRKLWTAPFLRPHLLHLDHRGLTEDKVRRYVNQNIIVAAWTVNDKKRAQELLDWGCGSIISDTLLSL